MGVCFIMKKLYILIAAAAFTACRSSKNIETSGSSVVDSQVTTVGQQHADATVSPDTNQNELGNYDPAIGENFTSKISLTITMGGKNVSTSGSLRMRRGEVMQVSLLDPIVGWTEVGRMELTPKSILIVDRFNKRYVETSYGELSRYAPFSLTYSMIEDMVWQEAKSQDRLTYSIPTAKDNIDIEIRINSRGNADNWEYGNSLSSKYQSVDINTLFRALMNAQQ